MTAIVRTLTSTRTERAIDLTVFTLGGLSLLLALTLALAGAVSADGRVAEATQVAAL